MERREILKQVAAGTLSPEEAAMQLDQVPAGQPEEDPAPAEPGTSIKRVRVVGDFRSAKIAGDPSVAEAIVEGSHRIRRDGDTLVIVASDSGENEENEWVFPKKTGARITIGFGSKPKPVSIRMNPNLALDVRIDAGSAAIEGVRGPIAGDIDAGLIRIKDFASPFDLQVDAGSVTAEGVLDRGASKIKCDAGNVKVILRKGSSVRVRARADVGHVTVGGKSASGLHVGGDAKEFVFGDGAGTLDITGGIGKIKVEEG